MVICVYSIDFGEPGKFYIGSTLDFSNRMRSHFGALRRKSHQNRHLQNAFNKPGNIIRFKVIEKCSYDNVRLREQYYISTLNPTYNNSKYVDMDENGRPISNLKLSKEDVLNIYNLSVEGVGAKEIANNYNIHYSTVYLIRNKKKYYTWLKNLNLPPFLHKKYILSDESRKKMSRAHTNLPWSIKRREAYINKKLNNGL